MEQFGRRHRHVVNVDEVEPVVSRQGKRYGFTRRQLGLAAGARGLGASLMELPPGRAAWPQHFHCANEEGLFVIQGTGELRIGDQRVPLRSGDYVTFPPGPDLPHQIYNNSGAPLVYLAVSTMIPTDISVYPRSDKLGLFAGAAPGGAKEERFLSGFYRTSATIDYWDGEPVDDDDDEDEDLFGDD